MKVAAARLARDSIFEARTLTIGLISHACTCAHTPFFNFVPPLCVSASNGKSVSINTMLPTALCRAPRRFPPSPQPARHCRRSARCESSGSPSLSSSMRESSICAPASVEMTSDRANAASHPAARYLGSFAHNWDRACSKRFCRKRRICEC